MSSRTHGWLLTHGGLAAVSLLSLTAVCPAYAQALATTKPTRSVTIPSGTRLGVVLGQQLSTRSAALALAASAVLFPTSARGQDPPSIGAAAGQPSSAIAPADTPTVAIIEFDFAAVHQWWAVELELGRGITELITDGFVNDGAYRVIERRFLESILAEQDLAADKRRSDPSATNLVRAGKLLGAQYLVVGSVTRFGTENKAKGAGGVVGRAAGLFNREEGKAVVSITARVVDATTGVVVASTQGEGMSSRKGLLLGGVGPGGFGGVSMRSSAFRETILGEATEVAVRQVVERLVAAKPRLTRQR